MTNDTPPAVPELLRREAGQFDDYEGEQIAPAIYRAAADLLEGLESIPPTCWGNAGELLQRIRYETMTCERRVREVLGS